ncbi:non-homologous end joining protein Ku [Solitalea koreensis]|uniref:Non-homologous end joining protein Ku n=1 Tax=Solitalea koreensis TaxID=543615 RepID=A0A521DF51_9SPHI|nr:Ku protein [Solitalea koreensis]SMO69771.1 DNA end-binding protein Ku [Solitalea koreensis]
MKAIWKGSINFGLVNIPIKLYSATQSSTLDLDMLDRSDHAPIRFKRVNENSGKEVPWENIVKGYKYQDDYVILEEADFEEASPEKSKTIQIENFLELKDVDPMYFESPYYVEPEKGGMKAYSLLHQALEKTQKAGLARFVLRTSEYLCLIRSIKKGLVIQKIRFPEEIRNMDELSIEEPAINKKELDMALALIKEYTTPFDLSSFKNSYTESLLNIIKAKAAGKRPTIRKIKAETVKKSDDLMDQLMKSLSVKKKVS